MTNTLNIKNNLSDLTLVMPAKEETDCVQHVLEELQNFNFQKLIIASSDFSIANKLVIVEGKNLRATFDQIGYFFSNFLYLAKYVINFSFKICSWDNFSEEEIKPFLKDSKSVLIHFLFSIISCNFSISACVSFICSCFKSQTILSICSNEII